jgi:single-strand DNA-binding protein
MPALNRVFLIGVVVRNPELRHTPKNVAVCDIALTVDRIWTDEGGKKREESIFVDVTLWAKQAEVAAKYLRKGDQAMIVGRLQLDQWDDKQTGQKRSRLKVVGENLQLLGSKPDAKPAGAPRSAASPQVPRHAGGVEVDLGDAEATPK